MTERNTKTFSGELQVLNHLGGLSMDGW